MRGSNSVTENVWVSAVVWGEVLSGGYLGNGVGVPLADVLQERAHLCLGGIPPQVEACKSGEREAGCAVKGRGVLCTRPEGERAAQARYMWLVVKMSDRALIESKGF